MSTPTPTDPSQWPMAKMCTCQHALLVHDPVKKALPCVVPECKCKKFKEATS